jgi:small subunit ribosomal protein S9
MVKEETTKKPARKAASKPAAKTTHKPAAKPVAKKAAASKKAETAPEAPVVAKEAALDTVPGTATEPALQFGKPTISGGRYVFATGRRKTAVANIRLFSGSGKSTINKKPVNEYFGHAVYQEELMQPFTVTGLAKDFYFTATVNGGGVHAQSQAIRHGLAQALASMNDDIKKVLKKNTFLTRDDRKKERKKPGLKRARRSPQWAKR